MARVGIYPNALTNRKWERWDKTRASQILKTVMTRDTMGVQSQKASYGKRLRSEMEHTVLRVSHPEDFSCEIWAVYAFFLSLKPRSRE